MLNKFSYEDLGVTRRESALSNGAKVIVFERPGMPVYMRAIFFAGSRFDVKGKEGLSHYLEHMLTAGSRRFPTKDKLAAYIEKYGGSLGATTGEEAMSVNVVVADPADIEVGFDILHEMLLESLFDGRSIETERGAIRSELGEKKSSPQKMIWDVSKKLLFQKTDLERPTLGTDQSLGEITKDDMFEFSRKYVTAGRMAFVVSGGITLDLIKKLAEDKLCIADGAKPEIGAKLDITRDTCVSVEPYRGENQVQIVFGFRTGPRFHAHNAALSVIAMSLGGGRASSMNRKLRLERGLVYGVSAQTFEYTDAGAWIIKTSTHKDRVQEVIDLICEEIMRVRDEGLREEEILFAKQKIIKSKRIQLQSSEQWVDWHAVNELLSNEPYTLTDFTRAVLEVTPHMVKSVAEAYFGVNTWYLTMCGDVDRRDVIVRL